jgi:hypothetical protein
MWKAKNVISLQSWWIKEFVTHLIYYTGMRYSEKMCKYYKGLFGIYFSSFHYEDFHQPAIASSNYNDDTRYAKVTDVDTYPARALLSGADNSLELQFKHVQEKSDTLCNKYLQGFRVRDSLSPCIISDIISYFIDLSA